MVSHSPRNGSTLPADHGYPVRVLVPGFAGVRNCKWLAKMELSDERLVGGALRRNREKEPGRAANER